MTDERFKQILKAKAEARKRKLKEVRAKERSKRKEVEKNYKEIIKLLAAFRAYDFIVLKAQSAYITIYSTDSYEKVNQIIGDIETQYTLTGELKYQMFRYLKHY